MPSFRCEHCRQKIVARDAYAGRRVRCPRCKQAVAVPAAEVVAPVQFDPIPPPSHAPAVQTPTITPEPTPVFTQRPPQDFSTIFSAPLDALFDSSGHDYPPEEQTQVLRPVHPREEPPSPAPSLDLDSSDIPSFHPEPEPRAASAVIVEPAEIIDAPPPMRSGLNSITEVADLLRGLDNPAQRARLAAASAAADSEVKRRVVAASRPVRALGWMSLIIGLAAVGLACIPAVARYAIAVGAGGLLLAVTGLALSVGRRAAAGLPAGGALISAAGLGIATLWAFGLIPFGAGAAGHDGANTPPVRLVAETHPVESSVAPEYVPASSPLIVNDVQIRVVSAQVVRPAIYVGDFRSLRTASDRRLQIIIELKNLGDSHPVYLPWRRNREGDDLVQLADSNGTALALDELALTDPAKPVVLAAAALRGPVSLGRFPISDVLLFEPPAHLAGNLHLDLPGRNIGQPGTTLHIMIPGSMVRAQGS